MANVLTSSKVNGNTRTYNSDGTAYTDTDANGRQVGGGLKGTENYGASGGSSGSSSGGLRASNNSYPSNIQSQINALKQSQIKASMASLGKARDSSLSNLSAEKAKIAPEYYGKRNSASSQSQLGAKNFAEFMAARGQTSSGVASQNEIANGVALQGQIGSLNQAEAGANVENARQVTNVQNAYNSDVVSAEANANATALQNVINQMNADRAYAQANDQFNKNYGLQQAGVTGTYNGQDTLAKTTTAQQLALQQAGVTGNYNGQATFAKQQADLAAVQFERQFGLSVGQAIGNYEGNPTLAAQAQRIQQAQFEASQTQNQNQFDRNMELQRAQLAASRAKTSTATIKSPTSAEINAQKDGLISQVTSAIYDKVYGQSGSSREALSTLTSNKGAILSDLASSGMTAKESGEFYKSMYDDLTDIIESK